MEDTQCTTWLTGMAAQGQRRIPRSRTSSGSRSSDSGTTFYTAKSDTYEKSSRIKKLKTPKDYFQFAFNLDLLTPCDDVAYANNHGHVTKKREPLAPSVPSFEKCQEWLDEFTDDSIEHFKVSAQKPGHAEVDFHTTKHDITLTVEQNPNGLPSVSATVLDKELYGDADTQSNEDVECAWRLPGEQILKTENVLAQQGSTAERKISGSSIQSSQAMREGDRGFILGKYHTNDHLRHLVSGDNNYMYRFVEISPSSSADSVANSSSNQNKKEVISEVAAGMVDKVLEASLRQVREEWECALKCKTSQTGHQSTDASTMTDMPCVNCWFNMAAMLRDYSENEQEPMFLLNADAPVHCSDCGYSMQAMDTETLRGTYELIKKESETTASGKGKDAGKKKGVSGKPLSDTSAESLPPPTRDISQSVLDQLVQFIAKGDAILKMLEKTKGGQMSTKDIPENTDDGKRQTSESPLSGDYHVSSKDAAMEATVVKQEIFESPLSSAVGLTESAVRVFSAQKFSQSPKSYKKVSPSYPTSKTSSKLQESSKDTTKHRYSVNESPDSFLFSKWSAPKSASSKNKDISDKEQKREEKATAAKPGSPKRHFFSGRADSKVTTSGHKK